MLRQRAFILRLSTVGDCTYSKIKDTYKTKGSFQNVELQCCNTDNCNLNWATAGGPATEAPGGRSADSGTAAGNEGSGAEAVRSIAGFFTTGLVVALGVIAL